MSMCMCVTPVSASVCVYPCSRVCSCFGKQQRNELQMPDGVLEWIANWATALSTHADTMESARTGRRQLEHRLACVCVCACVWGICITHEYHPGWCETVSCRGAQGEMRRPCWETLQSYLPSCLPLRLRPSLSTSPFPLSECAPICPHHHFSTLLYPYAAHPSLANSQPASALSFPFILCKRGVRLMSLFLGDYRVHRLCVFPISVAVDVRIC